MGAKVVHHHHLPLAQRGGEDPLYVGLEDSGGGSAFDGHGWSHPLHAHAGEHGGVPAAIAGHRAVGPLSLLGPTVYRSKRCVGAHLVYENQGAGIERLGDRHPPGGPSPLVSFQRPHSPFFREKPILFISLLKVGSLRLLPAIVRRKRRRSSTVAAGLACTSSSRSFLVASSAMGGLPPPFLGVRDSPRSASLV